MWLCLRNTFLSIVAKDCAANELMIRARRRGDIEKCFPEANVIESGATDYEVSSHRIPCCGETSPSRNDRPYRLSELQGWC